VCRFCHTELRDWKPVMTEAAGAKVVTPYMRVSFNGKTYKVQVQPGPEGAAAFEKQIRSLLQLPEGLEFDVIFHCRAPGTGEAAGVGAAGRGAGCWGRGTAGAGQRLRRGRGGSAAPLVWLWLMPHPAPLPHPPSTGDKLQLQGLNAFDAAVHCASLSNKQGGAAGGGGDKKGAGKKAPGPFGRLLAALGCRSFSASDEAARAGAP
jgi:hypothetical protein